jgi:hypothetical protein
MSSVVNVSVDGLCCNFVRLLLVIWLAWNDWLPLMMMIIDLDRRLNFCTFWRNCRETFSSTQKFILKSGVFRLKKLIIFPVLGIARGGRGWLSWMVVHVVTDWALGSGYYHELYQLPLSSPDSFVVVSLSLDRWQNYMRDVMPTYSIELLVLSVIELEDCCLLGCSAV